MRTNKRPPTAEQAETIGRISAEMCGGKSLNRACAQHGVSPATYYRRGGQSFLDQLEQARRARRCPVH